MLNKGFREWPEVLTPSGAHSAKQSMQFDFPLSESDRTAGEEASRGISASNVGDIAELQQSSSFLYRYRRELVGVLSVAIVAAVVITVALGYQYHVDSQGILNSCQQSAEIYQSNVQRLKKTVNDAADALAITEDQVQDASTVQTLHAAVDDAGNNPKVTTGCDASASAESNQDTDKKITKATQALGVKVEAIVSAQTAVEDSRNLRDISIARADLSNKVMEGQTIIGTVKSADLSTRQDLSAELNDAQQMVLTGQSDLTVLGHELNKVQSLIDKYNSTATAE